MTRLDEICIGLRGVSERLDRVVAEHNAACAESHARVIAACDQLDNGVARLQSDFDRVFSS